MHNVCRLPHMPQKPSPTGFFRVRCHVTVTGRDWSEDGQQWSWTRDPPPSQRAGERDPNDPKAKKRKIGEAERALTKFACGICKQLPTQPVSTPCDHHFCKPCLMGKVRRPTLEDVLARMHLGRMPKACRKMLPLAWCQLFMQSTNPCSQRMSMLSSIRNDAKASTMLLTTFINIIGRPEPGIA